MAMTDKAANLAHEAFDKIATTTNQAVETLGDKGDQLKNAEQRLMKNCRGYVRGNPMTSLSIVAAVGFVLGGLLSRR